MKPLLLSRQLRRLLWQHGLLLLLGLALYLLDKHEGLPPDVITGLLLAAATFKTGYFLLHNFRALAALRETFQQFILLVSLNLSMIALSFALDFYCLFRVNELAFKDLRPGSELERFGQLFYHSVGVLISNSGSNLVAGAGTTQFLLLLEKIAGFVSTVFVISNAANYLGPLPRPATPAATVAPQAAPEASATQPSSPKISP